MEELTPQQQKVVELVAQGHSDKIIGFKLNLSDKTIKGHIGLIFKKLNMQNRVQLAVWYVRNYENVVA